MLLADDGFLGGQSVSVRRVVVEFELTFLLLIASSTALEFHFSTLGGHFYALLAG